VPTEVPEVLADPVGVAVGLITGIDPLLDRPALEEVIARVAGGRAKRRRLAQALAERPQVLTDGRSPAPRVVGELLLALRQAGATAISPPVCATCGKPLRSLQRHDQDWYCSVCGPKREPCAACGKTRPVTFRDRQGRPRCGQCPPDDGRDPTDVVVQVVTTVDPSLPPMVIVAAVDAVVSKAGQRHQLAWTLQDRPELLTGTGAQAPLPAVLRLIDRLCDAGAQQITHPACPRCGRVIHLHRRIGGQWLCRNCVAKSRAQPCSRCGAVREAATRDSHGRPLCPNCLISDPVNQEVCVGCARRRRVSVRTPDGPLCESCRPIKTMTCSICGRSAPCWISRVTGRPQRPACRQRWARCSGCGQVQPVRGGTRTQPLCATCTRPDPSGSFWHTCPTCGVTAQLGPGPCARCVADRRLRELLGDEHGQIRPELETLHRSLASADYPDTVLAWLAKDTGAAILRALSADNRPLTHAALDELPDSKPLKHLRALLVATGVLPARDEHMARLERWVTRTIGGRDDPDQQLLHRYAVWHLLRRLRHRSGGADITHSQFATVRQHLRGAVAVLNWLTIHDLTLQTCRQGDLDAWLVSGQATHRREAGHFVRWAKRQKLTGLDFPAVKWSGPTGVIDTETRWQQARWLLHDDTLNPEDRVAGLLVLLYAQWPSTISRLTLDHVHAGDDHVRLQLGREPIVLPEPLAGLVLELVATRRGHATLGEHGSSRWLFPGGMPGRPVSSYQLAQRLRQLGVHPGQSRSTALFQLATDLPAAVLARMLGIHVAVAVAWQRACNGDWAAYAAQVSRRRGEQRQC
jgi:hypothetical protein